MVYSAERVSPRYRDRRMQMDKTGKKWKLSSFEAFTLKNAGALWIALSIFLVALPFVFSNPYFLTVVAKIGCYVILGLGLNILTGYTGLVSLGHAGFVAIGAYTASLLTVKAGCPFFRQCWLECWQLR